MRLDRVELLRKHTIAEYASERGADDARALLEPLLGTLYGFLVRRTPEPEDAEEALADTLLAARARAPKRAGDTRPLLGWLLSMALHTLRSRIEANPALESGLDHARADLPVRLRAGLLRALPRLSRAERLALGMRFADALPVAVIAQAMGRPERSVHTLLGTALASVGRACYPNLSLPQPEPEQLDCYVSTLHAGDHAVPPASLCAESAALVTALAELHTPVKIVPGVEERVWREYTERREEYLPGRPLPSAPTWLLPVGLVLLLALALGAGSLWLLSRQSPPEEPRRIAGAAPAPSATFAPASSEYTTTPTSPRPLYTPGPGRQALSELAGKLYFVQPGMVPELFSVHLGARDPAGLSTPERVLRFGPGTLTYDISPTDGTVAYSTGRGLWTQSAEGGIRYLAPLARLGPTGRPQRLRDSATTVRAHHATWHPQGHTVALVDAGWTPAGPGTGSAVYVYTPSLDTVLGEPLFVLGSDDEVTGLRWSTDGKYLAVRTRRGSHVVRVAAEGMRRRSFFLENRDVYWSPDPAIRDLLVTERRRLGVDAPFGVAEFDGTNYRLLGNAAFVSWQPDGKSVLFAQHGRRVDAGMSLWRLDLATRASEKMSDVPAMGRGVREVAFSPDGRYLAFTTAQGAWVASVSDGEAVELPGVSVRAHSLRWRGDPARYLPPRMPLSEPGTILYLRGLRSGNDPPRQTLNQLDPQTGKDIEVLAGAELGYAVSPFHTSVLVAADNRLELVALESGEITRLRTLPPSGQITALAWHPNGSEAAYVEDEHTATGGATVRLMSTDLRTARSTALWKPDARNAPTTLAYAPSGRWLLLWNRYGWSLLPARGGRPVDLPRAGSATYAWRPGPGPDRLLRS
ncbi:MAG: PD40 domain-containing protein, partial [Chloroflexia bacterium]|nr:PD40 domain-containing protein [Chloroflexia bacterium]